MGRAVGEGLKSYYKAKIEELEIQARDKQHNLRRLEAQRNDLNTKGIAAFASAVQLELQLEQTGSMGACLGSTVHTCSEAST